MEKKQFVEGTLSETVSVACGYVARLEYSDAEEIVDIVCQNGYRYHVNVACDSLSAIVSDVIAEILRH